MCQDSLENMPGFLDTFKIDLADPYYGFVSWNDFFARRLRDDFETVRPIANPDDPYTICSPCDAYPYFIARNVNERDEFWIKNQPYSIQHLLANDPSMNDYVGGTVYQAFLDTANYHRWHSPVDGKITCAYRQDGAYYAEALSMGYDPTANTYSQRYLTHVDTRVIIHIDTENPKIGKVIFVAVGMAEISSCQLSVANTNRVKKGDELGTFMFGGSTYCLLFKKGVQLSFTAEDIPQPTWEKTLQKVNSNLGTILEPVTDVLY